MYIDVWNCIRSAQFSEQLVLMDSLTFLMDSTHIVASESLDIDPHDNLSLQYPLTGNFTFHSSHMWLWKWSQRASVMKRIFDEAFTWKDISLASEFPTWESWLYDGILQESIPDHSACCQQYFEASSFDLTLVKAAYERLSKVLLLGVYQTIMKIHPLFLQGIIKVCFILFLSSSFLGVCRLR